jgi:uncharacterized membrane protein
VHFDPVEPACSLRRDFNSVFRRFPERSVETSDAVPRAFIVCGMHNETDERGAALETISKSRLEFLFDGVFAIAMTLLVLELHVPELSDHHSSTQLATGLAHNAATFGSYLLSYVVLGMFWYRHNHQYRQFRRISPGMLVLHFVQLAVAAFFPFSAALFGRYPFNALACLVYLACILLYSLASLGTWIVAKRSGSMHDDVLPDVYVATRNGLMRRTAPIVALFLFYLSRVAG